MATDDPDTITLGLLSLSHLGDVLCTTSLPRRLTLEQGLRVEVVRHPSTELAFAGNPFVAGLSQQPAANLNERLQGEGHVIQRLQRGLGLEPDPIPVPEVYLSDQERAWSEQQRQLLCPARPVCILSTRAVTDQRTYDFHQVDWDALAAELALYCTVIQPVLRSPQQYEANLGALWQSDRDSWSDEPMAQGAVVYSNLTSRQYLALFSIASAFCGVSSGGCHAAAAFGVAGLVVIQPGLLSRRHRNECRRKHLSTANFLYPQHHLLLAEKIEKGRLDRPYMIATVRNALIHRLALAQADRERRDTWR